MEEERVVPVYPVITVMQPVVVNVNGVSENVASEGISRDPDDAENIEKFGDFDNREDGK